MSVTVNGHEYCDCPDVSECCDELPNARAEISRLQSELATLRANYDLCQAALAQSNEDGRRLQAELEQERSRIDSALAALRRYYSAEFGSLVEVGAIHELRAALAVPGRCAFCNVPLDPATAKTHRCAAGQKRFPGCCVYHRTGGPERQECGGDESDATGATSI